MTQPWTDLEDDDPWLLQPDERTLLPGSPNDKGRLGFALQLKFRQANGRYPERLDEFDPTVVEVMAKQVGVDATTLSTYGLDSRQGQRHRQIIRRFLGFQLPTFCPKLSPFALEVTTRSHSAKALSPSPLHLLFCLQGRLLLPIFVTKTSPLPA